jgi:hypothetical protein
VKYSILINQAGIVQSGLHLQTDLVDWALLEYISDWQVHGRACRLNDHVWLNYGHLVEEMPMLGLNKKNSVSNRVKKLAGLGLITAIHDQDNRVYIKTTDYFNDICRFRPDSAGFIDRMSGPKSAKRCVPHEERGVPHEERGVPHEERGVPHEERGVPHEERGVPHEERGVPHEEHSINNQLINNQDKKITTASAVVTKKSGEKRGERLTLETLPSAWRDFCLAERPRLDADRVFARFRDYWIAESGARGRKLDWFATWRNWVRNENGVSNGARQQSGQQRKLSLVERAQQDIERLEARERREREFEGSIVG